MPQSWIQRWFLKQGDFTLWAIFIIWWIVQITVGLTIATQIAKLIVLGHL